MLVVDRIERNSNTMKMLDQKIEEGIMPQPQKPARGPETVFSHMAGKKQPFLSFNIPVIGLDIGGHSIKVVEIRKGIRSNRLAAAKVVEIFPDGPPRGEGSEVLLEEQRTEALRSALIGFRLNRTRIVASIGGSAVMVRQVQLPFMGTKKLESVLKWEVKRYLPYDATEMVLDAKILKDNKEAGKMDVLLVATRRDVLKGFTRFLKSAGVTPDVVDASPLALMNALTNVQPMNHGEAVAILDIGANFSTLDIHSSGGLLFNRIFSISGENFTNFIKEQLQISYAEAEILKRTDGSVFDMLRSAFDKLISDIHQTFMYYNSLGNRRKVERLVVSGGSAFLPKLVNYFATELNIEAEVLNPITGLTLEKDLLYRRKEIAKLSPQLTHAIGLALR